MRPNLLLNILLLLASIILSVYSQDGTDYSQCERNLQVDEVDTNFGSLNGFYSIAHGIVFGLQGNLPDDLVQDIYNLFTDGTNNQNIGDLVNSIMKSQVGTIIFWCVGIVIFFISIVLAIIFCVGRCCCNSCGAGGQAKKSSKIKVIIYLVLLLVAFAFIVTGIIIYNQSARNVYSQVDKGDVYTDMITGNLNSVLTNGTDEMTCSANVGVNYTFFNLKLQMQLFPTQIIGLFYDQTGLTQLQNDNDVLVPAIRQQSTTCETETNQATTDLNDLPDVLTNNQACKSDINGLKRDQLVPMAGLLKQLNNGGINEIQTNLQDLLNQVNTNVATTNSSINDQINDAIGQMNFAQDQISATLSSISDTVTQVMDQVNQIASIIKKGRQKVVDWNGYGWTKAGVQMIFTIPTAITLLFIAMTALALIFVLLGKNDPENRSFLSSTFGFFAILGFYYVIWTTWLVMGTSSTEFVGGWAIAGACKPIFGDPTFNVYGALNFTQFPIQGYNGTNVTISLRDILTNCSDQSKGTTMFSAVQGDQLMNVQAIEDSMNLAEIKDQIDQSIKTANFDYTVDPNQLKALQNIIDRLKELQQSLAQKAQAGFIQNCKSVDTNGATDKSINDLNKLNADFKTLISQLEQLANDITFTSNQSNQQNIDALKRNMTDTTNTQFDTSYAMVNGSLQDLVNQLSTNAFQCYPLVHIYMNTGKIICDAFGRPIHGLWASSGMAAIVYLPLAIVLLLASRWLFKGKSSSYEQQNAYSRVKKSKSRSAKNYTSPVTNAWDEDDLPPPRVIQLPTPNNYDYISPVTPSGIQVYSDHDPYGSRSLGRHY